MGSVRKADFLPGDIRQLFPSAHDIDYKWHIEHQAAWQRHVTSAVSKTINFPKTATIADVSNAYLLAYHTECKGITVYRDGSRNGQPLSTLKEKPISGKRSDVTQGSNRKVSSGCGRLVVYAGIGDHDTLEEITVRLGKGGSCASAMTESIARLASIALQHGVPPERIIKQMSGIRCHLTSRHKSKHTNGQSREILSCPDAIAIALQEHLAEANNKTAVLHTNISQAGACQDCGGQLTYESGCSTCKFCGYSRCNG